MSKNNLPHFILLTLLCSGCWFDSNTKLESTIDSKQDFQSNPLRTINHLIPKDYTLQSKEDYFHDKLLIATKSKLVGFESLHIKGHKFYELDAQGNITASYDISNNFCVYTYDKKNRLIKSENKQHVPPEVYYDESYSYSISDSVIEFKKSKYKNNQIIQEEMSNDIMMDDTDIKNKHFGKQSKGDLYINSKKNIIQSLEDEMIFCCGKIMKGKNKLFYYINKSELIDSVIIEDIESKEKTKFEYFYK